jgi:hypothetical protein
MISVDVVTDRYVMVGLPEQPQLDASTQNQFSFSKTWDGVKPAAASSYPKRALGRKAAQWRLFQDAADLAQSGARIGPDVH